MGLLQSVLCDIDFNDSVQLNWISDNEFYTHLKIYSPYNGLFSSMIGGRSGNRGKCAQPCRLPYELLMLNV